MPKRLSSALYYLSLICIALLSLILIRLIKLYDICCTLFNIVSPIFLGYVIAWMLNPIYKKLNGKMNYRISFCLLIGIVVIFYVTVTLLFIPLVIKEGMNLLDIINSFLPKLKNVPFIKDLVSNLKVDPSFLLSYCGNVLTILINFILAHMFGFYILYNYNTINALFRKTLPQKYKSKIVSLVKKISSNMYLYVKGTLIDMLILFALSAILFSIFGLKNALLLALFCAITNVIPFIGPYIGGIPAVIVGLTTSVKLGIITLIIIVLTQSLESNVINPLIMSKCIKINPLFIIIAITVMGKFFGVLGMILAVPTLIFFKIIFEFAIKNKMITLPFSENKE